MEEKRDFKGAWIPKEVWLDKRLNILEKAYIGLYLQSGKIEKIADIYMQKVCSITTLCKIKKRLRSLNLIDKIIKAEDIKEFVLKNKNIGAKCEWCGSRTLVYNNITTRYQRVRVVKKLLLFAPIVITNIIYFQRRTIKNEHFIFNSKQQFYYSEQAISYVIGR